MLAERQEQVRQTAVLFSKTQQELEAAKKAQTAWQEYLAELTPQLNKAKELDVQITEKQKQWLDAQAEEKKELRPERKTGKRTGRIAPTDKAASGDLEGDRGLVWALHGLCGFDTGCLIGAYSSCRPGDG